jgi:hypothetical protein
MENITGMKESENGSDNHRKFAPHRTVYKQVATEEYGLLCCTAVSSGYSPTFRTIFRVEE